MINCRYKTKRKKIRKTQVTGSFLSRSKYMLLGLLYRTVFISTSKQERVNLSKYQNPKQNKYTIIEQKMRLIGLRTSISSFCRITRHKWHKAVVRRELGRCLWSSIHARDSLTAVKSGRKRNTAQRGAEQKA